MRTQAINVEQIQEDLDALELGIQHGLIKQTVPEIETRLKQLRHWWHQCELGETVEAAPDKDALLTTFVDILNLAQQAQRSLGEWQNCLDLLDEIESLYQHQNADEYAYAIAQFNRYVPLYNLGDTEQVQSILESCLTTFSQAKDNAAQAAVLSALADFWCKKEDALKAVDLERQALAIREQHDNLEERAVSHSNLCNYLGKVGQQDLSASHFIAALVYFMVLQHEKYVNLMLSNLAIDIRQAIEQAENFRIPSLATVLEHPEFVVLHAFLTSAQLNPDEIQPIITQLIEKVHTMIVQQEQE